MTKSHSDWWYSIDNKRGFCFAAVKGYDYRPTSPGSMVSTLYLYLESGIFHLTGGEADAVYALVKGKVKT